MQNDLGRIRKLQLALIFTLRSTKCGNAGIENAIWQPHAIRYVPSGQQARGELLLEKFFVRKVIFAPLLCIMRQLYIVSYLDFRHGKCAVIYCFVLLLPLLARDTRSFLFHFKEHTRACFCEVNILFDISHSYLTSPRCVASSNASQDEDRQVFPFKEHSTRISQL